MTRVAVASRSFSRHAVLRGELLARFPEVTFNDAGLSLDGARLIEFLRGHDSVVVGLERIDDALLGQLPELRTVAKYGVGLDGLDLAAMARNGVKLGWRGGVNRRSVSELAIMAMIAILRRVVEGNREIVGGGWRQLQGRQLTGKTVGIIGCGHVGKDLAQLLRGFECRILAHDIRSFPEFYAANGIQAVSLDRLLQESDIVSLHVPLTERTRNLLSAERMKAMKAGAILINIARGGLIDETGLKALLREGHLAGAAFDVFATEPPQDPELLALPNFLATPHIGGSAEEAILAMGRAAIDGLESAVLPTPENLASLGFVIEP